MGFQTRLFRTNAACVLSCLGLLGANESRWVPELKLRVGAAAQSQDHLRAAYLFCSGALVRSALGGRFGFEVGYLLKSGDPWLEPVGEGPRAKAPVHPALSVDWRQNRMEGLAGRFFYQRRYGRSPWAWQAGGMVGGTSFHHQYRGDVQSADWNASNLVTGWRDTYEGSTRKRFLFLSPYFGFTWFSDSKALEINLLLLTYEGRNYVHRPGTSPHYEQGVDYQGNKIGGPISMHNQFPLDGMERRRRQQLHAEFGYVFRF